MNVLKHTLLLATLISSVADIPAETIDFTYNKENAPYEFWGTSRKETYDVAIRINNSAMAGCKVKEIKVPIHGAPENFTNVTGWLSSGLILSGKQNAPDIAMTQATLEPLENSNDCMLSAIFTDPYEIPEEGIYVGYSFNISSLSIPAKLPVAIVSGNIQDSFWFHASKTSEYSAWTDMTTSLGAMSAMTVVLEGEIKEYAAGLSLDETIYSIANESTPISVSLHNYGTKPISDIDFIYRIEETEHKIHVDLESDLMPEKTMTDLRVLIEGYDKIGDFPFRMRVDKIDGVQQHDNVWNSSSLKSLAFIPVNRPLVEEFTGLRCQYCPEGYVALEEMYKDYGDKFVALSYHVSSFENGAMVTTDQIPVENVKSFPSVSVNRGEPYSPKYLREDWCSHKRKFVPMDVDIEAYYIDESKSSIDVKADVIFAEIPKNMNYRLALCLVADGLSNPTWRQANYFSGMQGLTGEFWEIFTKGGKNISGLTYNFVVANFPDMYGLENSIPSDLSINCPYTTRYTFEMDKVKNILNESFINPEAKLRAVGIVIDTETGIPVNCNTSGYIEGTSGVKTSVKNNEIVSISYFDMCGNKYDTVPTGIHIKKVSYSDGTSKTYKAVARN